MALVDVSEEHVGRKARQIYRGLSSGHKIVLLSITKLVENMEEKTLVLMDEPEAHLHPPLLAAFVRALSDLLINRNGVAIIATHSPVVLQEVPRSCVWKIVRHGRAEGEERAGKPIHIGGQFEPEVSVQLKILAAKERRPVIALLCEGINLVFEARGLPPIAAVTRPPRQKPE